MTGCAWGAWENRRKGWSTTMKKFETRLVPFMGSNLVAARDGEGRIWAGVKWICSGIGLSRGQVRHEQLRIQSDEVLSKGKRNLVLSVKGRNQEVLCLGLEYVPLWLEKVFVTKTMEEEKPELAERLSRYQAGAKDALAAAFQEPSGKDESDVGAPGTDGSETDASGTGESETGAPDMDAPGTDGSGTGTSGTGASDPMRDRYFRAAVILSGTPESHLPYVLEALRRGGIDLSAASLPDRHPDGVGDGDGARIRELLEEILPRIPGTFLPFDFLYYLYVGWLGTNHPDAPPCGMGKFIENLGPLVENYGWALSK